jgi:hypothetical protein
VGWRDGELDAGHDVEASVDAAPKANPKPLATSLTLDSIQLSLLASRDAISEIPWAERPNTLLEP